jgi:hypothetical protein
VANQTTNGCGPGGGGATALLPVSPFYAPRYHFGMLLGVDDFEAEQGYHRGKLRLHNAWLHGAGVVWGLGVEVGARDGRVTVYPGLALDAAGRELYLDADACVSLSAWYDAHRDDPDVRAAVQTGRDGVSVSLDLHVVARFRACASRPVPSIAEPCDAGGATDGIAFSRAQETVELLLRPRLVPPRPRQGNPYHRLRLLFSLDEPVLPIDEKKRKPDDDDIVVKARNDILALPPDQQPFAYLEALRRFAADDEIDLAPAKLAGDGVSLFPADDDCEVVLANVPGVVLKPGPTQGGQPGPSVFAGVGTVDVSVRPSHVATSTIEELLCGPLFALAAGGGSSPAPTPTPGSTPGPTPGPTPAPATTAAPDPDAGGPRIDPGSVTLGNDRVTLEADRRLARGSVRPEAFSVSAFEVQRGWHDVEINSVRVERDQRTVHLVLASGFLGHLVRVIAKGTGPAPLLGADHVPLAGRTGGPAGSKDDGHDLVVMIPRSAS